MAVNKHQSSNAGTHEWVTPRDILDPLGDFDLDPCAPKVRPWDCAKHSYTIDDDGLAKPWFGRVWCNPPYGRFATPFVLKMSQHKEGLLLVFVRTETKLWQQVILPTCHSIRLLDWRPTFHYTNGKAGPGNCGGPMCLVSWNEEDTVIAKRLGGVTVKPML